MTPSSSSSFALQLKHGWTVSGPLHLTSEPFTNKVTVNRITVREIESVKEIVTPKSLLKMFEFNFSENASNNLPEELGHSQEHRRFLMKVSKGIGLTEGHYEIPLLFRQSEVDLPNNRQQAVKRALWQRKKMLQNHQYQKDYVAFINEIINKGYAERVPQEILKTDPGKAWYIPHYGVYHPKKPDKIRGVFDCTWTTAASVLLAPKLKPRKRSKVCAKYAQRADFASLSSSATDGVSWSPFPRKNVPKM